jgi:hypothetical protein
MQMRWWLLLAFFTSLTVLSCQHDPIILAGTDPVDTSGTGGTDTTGNGGTDTTDTGGTDTTDTGGSTGIPCDPDTVYFQNDILPIFISNCAMPGCHDAGTAKEGFVFDSYENIMASGEIVPGNPGEGDIYDAITEDDFDKRMPPPPNSPLTNDQVAMIYQWIKQGAKNNYCGGGDCDTSNVTFSGTIFPIIQTNCLGCHSGNVVSGGINLSTYDGVYNVVVDGRLYGAVNQTAGYTAMPLGSRLSDCEILQINYWINDGAPNN